MSDTMADNISANSRVGDELITPGAAAKLRGVTTRTLINWVREGRLPCEMLPTGQRRYRRRDVENVCAATEKV